MKMDQTHKKASCESGVNWCSHIAQMLIFTFGKISSSTHILSSRTHSDINNFLYYDLLGKPSPPETLL
jgi:hypothetical protein